MSMPRPTRTTTTRTGSRMATVCPPIRCTGRIRRRHPTGRADGDTRTSRMIAHRNRRPSNPYGGRRTVPRPSRRSPALSGPRRARLATRAHTRQRAPSRQRAPCRQRTRTRRRPRILGGLASALEKHRSYLRRRLTRRHGRQTVASARRRRRSSRSSHHRLVRRRADPIVTSRMEPDLGRSRTTRRRRRDSQPTRGHRRSRVARVATCARPSVWASCWPALCSDRCSCGSRRSLLSSRLRPVSASGRWSRHSARRRSIPRVPPMPEALERGAPIRRWYH